MMKIELVKDHHHDNLYIVTAVYGVGDREVNDSIFCTWEALLELEDKINQMRKQKNDLEGLHE